MPYGKLGIKGSLQNKQDSQPPPQPRPGKRLDKGNKERAREKTKIFTAGSVLPFLMP